VVSATCTTPVVVLKLDRDRLLKLLDSDMESGYLFFKHLSRALGGRLVQAYHRMTDNDLGGYHGKT
jgi:CRP-like cAMP-binding protein